MSNSLRPQEPQYTKSPWPSPIPGVHPNLCPLSRQCHPTILSSFVPFSSCPQSFPTSGSFQMSQLFTSGGQNIGVSASTSVLPMNTQDWSPLGWTGWISLQFKGLSRVLSNTTVQKHHSSQSLFVYSLLISCKTVETVSHFIFWAPKSLQMVIAPMKLKDTYSLKGKLWPT